MEVTVAEGEEFVAKQDAKKSPTPEQVKTTPKKKKKEEKQKEEEEGKEEKQDAKEEKPKRAGTMDVTAAEGEEFVKNANIKAMGTSKKRGRRTKEKEDAKDEKQPKKTKRAGASDTLFIVCAIMSKEPEPKYLLDALRWVQLAESKGIDPANIHLFVSDTRLSITTTAVQDLAKDFPSIPFPLTPSLVSSLVEKYNRGRPHEFLEQLVALSQNPAFNRITCVLINHGDSQGGFGSDYCQLEQNQIFDALNAITKPCAIICSACYAQKILFLLDKEHKEDNFVKIWDHGEKNGVTYYWGVTYPTGEAIELGTQLCFWLFDILYAAQDGGEFYVKLLATMDKKQLDCTVKISGHVALLREPFFGPLPPGTFTQPPLNSIIKTTESERGLVHPQFTNELVDIVDRYLDTVDLPLTKDEFWKWVYDPKFLDAALQQKNGFEEGNRVAVVLKDRKLISTKCNGAGLTDVLVVNGWTASFLRFLASEK